MEQTFDGQTFKQERDGARLTKQLEAVKRVMGDGQWHTLHEVCEIVKASTASVSARIRDLRKAKFGGFTIERQYIRKGVWAYKLIAPQSVAA